MARNKFRGHRKRGGRGNPSRQNQRGGTENRKPHTWRTQYLGVVCLRLTVLGGDDGKICSSRPEKSPRFIRGLDEIPRPNLGRVQNCQRTAAGLVRAGASEVRVVIRCSNWLLKTPILENYRNVLQIF